MNQDSLAHAEYVTRLLVRFRAQVVHKLGSRVGKLREQRVSLVMLGADESPALANLAVQPMLKLTVEELDRVARLPRAAPLAGHARDR